MSLTRKATGPGGRAPAARDLGNIVLAVAGWRRGGRVCIAAVVFLLVGSARLHADDQAESAYAQYKAAVARRDIEQAATYICQAAKFDPKKYQKKCESAERDANDQLQKFDALMIAGRAEFKSRDYNGVVRDLGRITFGPHREEAQEVLQQAKDQLAHSPGSIDASMEAYTAAQAAYLKGDFAGATASAAQIKAPSVQPLAKQILQNISMYNATVAEGDALKENGNYAAAQSKYLFAQHIKDNGPGNLTAKLADLSVLMIAAKTDTKVPKVNVDPNLGQAQGKAKGPVTPLDPVIEIKRDLAEARDDEQKGKLQPALTLYERVLLLDPKQSDAVAGRQRTTDAIQKDPEALEKTLASGIRNYYRSAFREAHNSLVLYLQGGGRRGEGAAHFYLGATYMTQALMADSREKGALNQLQKSASEEFHLARQSNYKPIEKYVSPRIWETWNRSN